MILLFDSIRKLSKAIGSRSLIAKSIAIGGIRLLSVVFALSARAAIETAPDWAESEPPIRFKSRDWADAVLAAASTNSSIAIEGGRLLANTTWDATKTHLVFNTVYIPSGITLTISEGAVVKFCPGTTIKVEDGGKLSIVGASGNDVILTAANDATVGEVVEGLGEESIAFDGIRLQSTSATFTDNSHLETRGFNYGAFPTVSVLGTEAVRNGGVAYVPFTLSGSSRETAFSIEWEAVQGTAKFGDDYTLASGTISWGKSSEGTKTLRIPLNAANVTGEERTFTVRIKAARGSNIGTRTATVKIVERDALTLEWAGDWAKSEPPIRFKSRDWADAVLAAASTNDAIAIEGGRLLTNTTWDATKTHLIFNTVYVPSGVTLTISEGAIVKFCPGTMIKVEDGGKLSIVGASGNDVILTAANDATAGEAIAGLGEESFAFGGIRLQSTSATFTDNGWLETRGFNYGAYPSVTLNDSTAFRSSGLASIPVTISGTRDQTLTIDWVAVDDTAKYGEDYTLASGRITWGKASEGTKTISIPLVTTNIVGATTSFKIKIVTARGANIADGECTVSIREFDTLNIESGSAESTPPIRFKSRDWADAVLAAASTNDAIAIEGGRLLTNTTWDATKTHLVFNTVYIPSGITLTISEGAVVKFCPGTMIKVEDGGKLNIVGASGNDVILTAANDATAGEAIAGLGAESIAFDGIRLQSTAATFTDNGWLETRGFNYGAYPSVTLHDATANRKAGMVYLPVTVGGTTRNQSFTVDWVAEDESAQFGRDYATHNSGRLTWSKSGDGTKYITIPLVTTENAGSNRTFKVRFVVARGVNVTDGEATVIIAEFAFDGLNGQPVEITTNAVSSTEFAIKEGIGSQPIFLNDVEQVRYSGKWQTYDENEAAALRVTVDSDNGTKVLKECSVEETGTFELRQSDYATGFYTLKHEILNNLGETLATMKKSFSIIDTEDVELHGGILTQSETWSADKVHVVYETVTVPAAYTLFIEPGAIVKFMTGTGIDISQGGALFANKIVFTHINDDTIGGDTLSDGYTVAPPMDAYTLSGNFTFGDDTELRNITQNTALAGTISTCKVLSRGSTYRVSGTVTIANGGSLTIPPGTVLKMESGASIVVNSGATLTAIGTRVAPIIITSIKDDSVSGDTNGDGDKTIPQPGDWEEIKNNGGTVNLAFVSALYGGYGQYSNQGDAIIRTASGTTTMDCCVVMHSNLRLIGRTGGTVSAVNCILQDGRWGIDGAVTFVNGVIADCNTGANGATVRNSILWECDTYASGGAISDCVCWGVDSSRPQSIVFNEASGNIWGDPLFVNPDNGDFRIQEGSPCVDAADSSVAPEFDYYGQPRITVTEQGTNTVGQLADIGICELMPRNVTSDIDLVPQNVRTVTNAVPGELLFVKWEVKNAGGKELEGAWRDTVSLVSSNGREIQLGVKTTSGVIAPGGSIFCSGYFTIPPISEGEWYPKVNVNSYRDVFEGALGVNNALVGDRALTVMAEALDPSVAREGVIGGGTPSVIKLTFGADDENRMVKFDVPAGVKVTWGFGFMPQGASQSGSMIASDGGVMFRVPEGATDVYVVLESDKTATYEMTTESTKMVITGVMPNTLPASGTTTLTITGAGFGETNAVSLVCGREEVLPKSVLYVNPETIIIVVEGDELIQGENYDLQIAGLNTVKVDDVLTVVQIAKKGKLQAKLDVPSIIREGRITTGYIEYENIGDGDMYAPIFKLSNSINTSEVMFSLEANGKVNKEKIKVVGLGSNYPKGILRAGEKCRVPFYFTLKGTGFRIHLSVVDMDSEEIRESVYKTWKEFSEAISQSATLVNGLNYSIYDYEKIYDNAMRKAYGQGFNRIAGKLVNVLTDMPMPDQTLYLVDSNDCAFAKSVTDMDGYFSFDGLCNGEKFSIISQTCQARYNDILVGEISNTELVIYGAGLGTVACKIGDVKPHKVFLTNRDTLKSIEMEKSDENVYLSEGLEDGEYVITPVFDGFYCSTNSMLAFVDCGVMTNAQATIEAVPSGKLELNIINYDGLSVSGVVCTAFSDNLNYKSQVYCDEYGKATFNLPPSEYTFSFNNGFIGDTDQIKVTVGNMLHENIEVKKIPFVAFPSFGQAPLKSNFRLVNTNGFNAIVSCSWDFENDGVYDATGICVTNNYNDIGEYSVKCRIGFSDGSSKEFVHQNAIETFEAEKNEGVNGSLVLDDSSGYQISYTDDQKITLSVNNNAIPRYIAEGLILIVPNDDMRPRKVLEIATLDKYTIDVKTEFVSPMVAYNNAILRFNGQKMRGIVPDAIANLNVDDGGNIGLIGTVSHDFGACEISLNLTGVYTYNFAILIRDGKIKKLEHQSGFTGEFEVEGKIHTDDEKEKDKKQIYRISHSSGPKKKTLIDKVFPVGVVPFRLTARALLDAGLKGSFSASVFYGATIAYANGTWTDNYEKSFTPSFALEGEAFVKGGIELDGGIGIGKDILGTDFGLKVIGVSLEAGAKGAAKVDINFSETEPDEYEIWAGIYGEGSVDLLKVSLGEWFEGSLASCPFGEEWKLLAINWKSPIPDFSVTENGITEFEAPVTMKSTTKSDYNLSERRWEIGGVNFGSGEALTHVFRCYPDDYVTYTVKLYEKYELGHDIFAWVPRFAKVRSKDIRLKGATSDDEDGDFDVDDSEGSGATSYDPNEMAGPLGLGDPNTERFVKPGEWMTYTVYFENMTNATAAAQEVYVTNPLSEWLDWSTFEMGEVSFGNQIDLGLSGKSSGTTEKRMDGTNWIVRTELSIEPDTTATDSNRQQKMCAKWYLRIVDPTTSTGWPNDPVAGFLPPNNPDTHCGEGHLTYRIKLRDDAPAGLVITNSATIVFDYNEPITTDPAWWNTVAKTVDVDCDGGLTLDDLVVGLPFGELSNPEPREGYIFEGWYTGKNGTGTRVTADTIVTAGMTSLYAHWTQIIHTVIVDGVATNVAYGTELMFTAPESFIDDTCTTQLVYVGTSFYQPTTNEFSIVVTNNIEFTWDILATNYWLNIDQPLHGAIIGATNGWYLASTVVDLSVVEDTGYSFNKWNGDIFECTELGAVLSVPMNKPRSIGASFVAEGYTITYAGTKDIENTNPTSYTIEDEIVFVPLLDVDGWKFTGWQPASISRGSTGDVTVTAQWERIVHSVTVGGVTTNVTYGTEMTFVAPEPRVDETGTTQLVYIGSSFYQSITNEFTVVVTNNIDFIWDILATNYWLNVDQPLHGAITGATNGWYLASTVVDLSAVEDTGYSFNKWNGDIFGCTELGAVLSVPMNKPRSIGASFDAEDYTITYSNTNDAENLNPLSYTIEDEIIFEPLSDVDGWKFTGWQPASISRGSIGNVTVIAQWSEIKPELGKDDYRVAGDKLDGTVPEKAASVYDGYLYLDNAVIGTIQAKVSKPKLNKKSGVTTAKTSVTIQITGEKKITLKGELDVTVSEFVATDKKSDRVLILKFGSKGITGTFGKYDIDGARNLFDSKDKSEKSTAEEILKPYLGAYSMILDGGILSVTIAKKGKVTIKGSINGNKVALKAQALIGEDMICIPVIYSKKSVNLAFTIWLPINSGNAVIIGLDDAIIGKAGTLKNGAKFIIDGDIGDFIETEDPRTLELLPDNEIITVSKSKWLVADGIKPAKVAYKKGEFTITEGKKGAGIVNPSGLKLSYKSKDGSFTGSFTAYAIVKGKLKKHKATVEGILIGDVGYGTITIKKVGTWAVTIK